MTCPDDDSKVGSDLLSTPPTDGSKPSPEALALAERISKGEVPAVHQALLATLAMELARRPDGVQALRNVSTPRGLALVFQALLERWDVKLLLSRPSWLRPQAYWDANQFLKEVGWAALRTVAERTGRSRESVLVEAVGLVPSDPVMTLHSVVSEDRPLYYAIGRFARSPAGGEVTPATAREFLDRINRETAGNDPQEIEAESKRITALYHAKDVMALKQIASPLYPPNDFHALLAACYLVGLGEEEFALPLLEKRTPLGLLHDLNAIRSEVKQLLDRAEPGARKERLQRLYEKLSKHCKLNDCTTESPR